MNYIKWLVIGLILNQATLVSGQEIRKLPSGEYRYLDDIFKYADLDLVFAQDELAYKTYSHANTNLKAGKILGVTSLISFGIGGLALAVDGGNSDMYCDLWCPSTGQVVGIISWFLVVPGTGIPALITHGIGAHLKKQSIDQFNHREVIGYQPPLNGYMTYGVTSNGIGLTYTF